MNCIPPPFSRPPYESGELYTSGKCPGDGFDAKAIIIIRGGYPLHKWVKPAQELT